MPKKPSGREIAAKEAQRKAAAALRNALDNTKAPAAEPSAARPSAAGLSAAEPSAAAQKEAGSSASDELLASYHSEEEEEEEESAAAAAAGVGAPAAEAAAPAPAAEEVVAQDMATLALAEALGATTVQEEAAAARATAERADKNNQKIKEMRDAFEVEFSSEAELIGFYKKKSGQFSKYSFTYRNADGALMLAEPGSDKSDDNPVTNIERTRNGYTIEAKNSREESCIYFLGDDGCLKSNGMMTAAKGLVANQVRANINDLLNAFGHMEEAAYYEKVEVKSDPEGRVPKYIYIFDENGRLLSKEPLKLHRTIMLGDMAKRVLPMNATRYFVKLKEYGLLLDGVLGNRDTNNFDLARIISSIANCLEYINSCKQSIIIAIRNYMSANNGTQPTYSQLKDYYHANREKLSLEYVDPGKELMLNYLDSATFNMDSQAKITIEGIEAGFEKAPEEFSDKQDLIIQYKNDQCFGYPGGFEYYLLNAWINSIEETLIAASIDERGKQELLSKLQDLAETSEFDSPDSSIGKVERIHELITAFNDEARRKGVNIAPINLECFRDSRNIADHDDVSRSDKKALSGLNVRVKQFFKDHESDGPIFKTFKDHCVTAKTMVIGGVNVRLAHYPSLLVHGNAQGLEDKLTLAEAYLDQEMWSLVVTASRPSEKDHTFTAHPVGVDLTHQLKVSEDDQKRFTVGVAGHAPVKLGSGPQATDGDSSGLIIFADWSRTPIGPNDPDILIGGGEVVIPGYPVTCLNTNGDMEQVQTTERIIDYNGRWIKGAPNLKLPASVLETLSFPDAREYDKCEITEWIINKNEANCVITASKGRNFVRKLYSYKEVKAKMEALLSEGCHESQSLINKFKTATRDIHRQQDQLAAESAEAGALEARAALAEAKGIGAAESAEAGALEARAALAEAKGIGASELAQALEFYLGDDKKTGYVRKINFSRIICAKMFHQKFDKWPAFLPGEHIEGVLIGDLVCNVQTNERNQGGTHRIVRAAVQNSSDPEYVTELTTDMIEFFKQWNDKRLENSSEDLSPRRAVSESSAAAGGSESEPSIQIENSGTPAARPRLDGPQPALENASREAPPAPWVLSRLFNFMQPGPRAQEASVFQQCEQQTSSALPPLDDASGRVAHGPPHRWEQFLSESSGAEPAAKSSGSCSHQDGSEDDEQTEAPPSSEWPGIAYSGGTAGAPQPAEQRGGDGGSSSEEDGTTGSLARYTRVLPR